MAKEYSNGVYFSCSQLEIVHARIIPYSLREMNKSNEQKDSEADRTWFSKNPDAKPGQPSRDGVSEAVRSLGEEGRSVPTEEATARDHSRTLVGWR